MPEALAVKIESTPGMGLGTFSCLKATLIFIV